MVKGLGKLAEDAEWIRVLEVEAEIVEAVVEGYVSDPEETQTWMMRTWIANTAIGTEGQVEGRGEGGCGRRAGRGVGSEAAAGTGKTRLSPDGLPVFQAPVFIPSSLRLIQ